MHPAFRVVRLVLSAARARRFLPILVCMVGLAGRPDSLAADALNVQFDLHPVVACRDVTSAEFAAAEPDERLVEAVIEVSALIRHGGEDDLLQFFYRLESPTGALRVASYAPRTTLASDQAGNVAIETKQEGSRHAGLAVAGPTQWPLKLTGSADWGGKSLDAVRYELVPQSIAVTASGTLQRGHGVYFKLKPSRSSTLEGARQFSVVFRVPAGWRAGSVQVSCTAHGIARGLLRGWDSRVICGSRRFAVALHRQGDAEAKTAAERLVRAEADLWQVVRSQQDEIQRRSRPTFVHRVGVPLDLVSPAIPADWPQQLVYGEPQSELEDFTRRLPGEVQQAVSHYGIARRELHELGEGGGPVR